MKRNIIYIILINIIFFSFIGRVDAALDLRILTDSSTKLPANTKYNVSVVYVDLNKRGNLNNLSFDLAFKNANCSITSGSCNAGNHCSFTNVKKGATLVQLSCVKGSNNESFIISNVVGKNASGANVNLKATSLSISTDTTKPTTVPTTSPTTPIVTTPPKTTTKRTTRKTTTTTTTTTTSTTTTVQLPDFSEEKSELKLKNLKIIGYDINFDKDKMEYTIKVKDDVLELDVVATPLSRDIVIENTGRINIENINQININLSREDEKATYVVKIEKVKVKKVNFLLIGIVMLAIIIVSGLIVMQLINRRNIKREEFEFIKEIDDGKEDAKILMEEEEEFTKTFFDLNKR